MTNNKDHQSASCIVLRADFARRTPPGNSTGRMLAALLIFMVACVFCGPLFAANLYWVGTTGGTVGAPGNGNWNTATLAWDNTTGDSGNTANSAYVNGSTAIFGGSGVYTASLTANLTGAANNLQFNSGSPTLAGSGGTRSISVQNTLSVLVASGVTATIANSCVIDVNNGSYTVGQSGSTAGGTINLFGTIRSSNSGYGANIDGNGTTVDVMTGGFFGNSSAGGGAATCTIGTSGGADSTLVVDGGTVSVGGANHTIAVGGNGAGTLTLNNGSVTMAAATTKNLVLGNGSTGAGTANLNGGTMSVLGVAKGSGTAVFNFNGGTLKANANNANFMTGLTTANIRNSGAVIDNNGKTITINQALVHSTIGGDNAKDGGLISLGAGMLTLSGANTYSGDTAVNGGALTLDAAGTLTYYIGANGVNNKITGNGTGSLTLNGTFNFDLTGADDVVGNSWLIVDQANVSTVFGGTFAVAGFTQNGTQWTSGDYVFDQSTGMLNVAAVPEPGVTAFTALGLGLFMASKRFRQSV
jgi:autotransporter-associated beta strand protein